MTSKTQRLEYEDEKSSKFWEISLDGDSHTVTYGRLGSNGQSKTKSFADSAAAKKSSEKLIGQKLAKGYVKANATAKTAAKKKPVKKKVAGKSAARDKHHLPKDLLKDFEKQIEAHELSEFRSVLLGAARPKLGVNWGSVIKRMPRGMSRIGGPPDVASESDWISEYDDGRYKIFFFQINMADVPSPVDFNLPKKGLLSMYVWNQNMVDDHADLVFNKTTDNLQQLPLPKKLKEYCDDDLSKSHQPACAKPARKLTIEKGIWLPNEFPPEAIYEGGDEVEEAYMELCDHYSSCLDMFTPHTPSYSPKNSVCLFRLGSCQYFEFGDVGYQYVFVKRGPKGLDFSKTTGDYGDY